MQLMNFRMNVLVSAINQMLEHNASLAQRAVAKDVETAGCEKPRLDGYEAWRKAQTESASKAPIRLRAWLGEGNPQKLWISGYGVPRNPPI